MAVVWPKKNNTVWPLPADYSDLTGEGQRLARVNAVTLQGRPDLEVASWDFFRRYYLFPTPEGMFYKQGLTESPASHYRWVYDWHAYERTCTAAPRGGAKSTLCKENILRKIVSRNYWETLIFLAKSAFVTSMMEDLMVQIEHNQRIVEDFGVLKPKRGGTGIWNHSQIKLTNGSMVTGMSITGASLGKRPSGEIYCDDVEKSDDMILCPSALIDAFKSFLFNIIFPMARLGRAVGRKVPIRIIGTLLTRRSFLYWMHHTNDPRITKFWKCLFYAIQNENEEGVKEDFWSEWMGKEFQEDMLSAIGPAAYAAQYLNDPGTAEERLLYVHPELGTYTVENMDEAYTQSPLTSISRMVSHQLAGYTEEKDSGRKPEPIPKQLLREFGPVVSNMRRFITVDYAQTYGESADYSVVHVIGLENSPDYRDTLWSLDCEVGKWPREELIRRIYRMAVKWGVSIIGVEAYPIQMEYAERLMQDLPDMFGSTGFVPYIMPIKFPPSLDKPEKIMGMQWRFVQFRVKLPLHLRDVPGSGYYGDMGLWYQVENFTRDLNLLRYDDALDTLAMHQAFGKPGKSVAPDRPTPENALELLKNGEGAFESGIPVMSGMNASDIPRDVWEAMLDKHYEGLQDTEDVQWVTA